MPNRTGTSTHAAAAALAVAAWLAPACPVTAQASTGWSDRQIAKRASDYANLTPERVAAGVQVREDSLEPLATFTTEQAYRFRGGFTDRVRADPYLRGFVAKTTGEATFQLYATLSYSGDLRGFDGATYETAAGPQPVRLSLAHSAVDCTYGTCIHQETLGFDVPEAVLKDIAGRASERPVRPWRFRFKAQNGEDWTDDIAPVEVAGLLQAVDSWRDRHSHPTRRPVP